MRSFSVVALVFLAIFLDGVCVAAAAAPVSHRKIFLAERAGGQQRSFLLYVPAAAAGGDTPRPLVVALHGGVASARILAKQSGLDKVADRHGFLVAYPNGSGLFGLLRHWNGGYCCARALRIGLDDLGFVDRVIERVAAEQTVDRRRIYVIGYSNGGMLAYQYAATRADKLAGLAIWASSIGSLDAGERSWRLPAPAVPLPVLIAHGRRDPRLPFAAPTDRDGRQRLLGAVGSAEWWAAANGCSAEPEITRQRDGAVERRRWCADSAAPVVLLGLEGWGHEWPGPARTERPCAEGPLRGFHLAEEMWAFLHRHSTP